MAFCIALAVRDMRHDRSRRRSRRPRSAAPRRCAATDIGHLAPGARADAVVLDAPSYAHLVYRPGVPLTATVFVAGEVAYRA